ncbi:hypothetical protein Taro_031291 [Colocasia esculenta]|uniref:Cyclin-like domain-containing protein n=1 Tax=Colocasia esculenta TaxID=4460 RepID=A0A843W5Z1_COLES|nr:hypothetical protein [Colocasia esculenta]
MQTIATVCMFLAGKVEETPRSLNNVILVSYEIIHKKDPAASQRIKQKEVYEQQKELILLGERVVLATLGFDLNVHHPYKPLVEAIKKFKVAQNALAQVAWNFVNDGLRTSLCLQYKPHHIAAGAIFLAAKFLKVKLPSDGEKVWWQEFDVTPRQLEDVSNQMLELYEQNRTVQAPTGSEVDGSSSNVTARPPKTPTVNEETLSVSGRSQTGVGADVKHRASTLSPARSLAEQPCSDNQNIPQRCAPHQSNESGSAETVSGIWDTIVDADGKDAHSFSHSWGKETEASIKPDSHVEVCVEDVETDKGATGVVGEWRGEGSSYKSNVNTLRNTKDKEASKGHCLPVPDAIKRIDKDRLKAALEKRKKIRGNMPKNADLTDEDDLIERELENGVELAVEDEKIRQESRKSWPKTSSHRQESDDWSCEKEKDGSGDKRKRAAIEEEHPRGRANPKSFDPENGVVLDPSLENVEEGELSSLDSQEPHPPKVDGRSVKATNSGRQPEGMQRSDHPRPSRDPNRNGRPDYMERDPKRHRHEAHV